MPRFPLVLIPQSCWFSNIRDHVSKEMWDVLRKRTYKLAHYRCQVCGGRGAKHPVECHEIWQYDNVNWLEQEFGIEVNEKR